MKTEIPRYDIIILGGGIAGSVMAISLKRKTPALTILIIERSSIFPNKVGESSAEMTGLFFNRFGIEHILKKQIPKAGLRFLFNEHNTFDPEKTDEFSSPSFKSIANGYHFNRQQFDEDLLAEATKMGCEIRRPAEIIDFNYEKLNSLVRIKYEGKENEFRATWLIDASGTERIVGKKMGWQDNTVTFDTAASLAHFENLGPINEWDKLQSDIWKNNAIGPQSQSTIHFLRHGCWWWHIVLNNNTTSIGVVYDKSILGTPDAEKFFNDYLENDELLKHITQGATRGPIKHLPKLPYLSKRLYNDGLVVIGDSAAFIDPLFSPGIEFICQQSINLTDLIADYFKNNKMNYRKWNSYQKVFLAAFSDRIKIYQDRYKLMGSYDLFSNWVQLDFFGYFCFTIFPSVVFPGRMKTPPRFLFPSNLVYKFVTNRYLKIAARRKIQGRLSTSLQKPVSYSHISIPNGFMFYLKVPQLFFIWFINYMRIEIDEVGFMWFSEKKSI